MENYFKNQLRMYDQVHTILGKHRVLWEGLPAFVSSFDHFNSVRESLHLRGAAHSESSEWETEVKHDLMGKCLEKTFLLKKLVHAFAVKSGNEDLNKKSEGNKREFFRGREEDKLNKIKAVVQLARQYETELMAFGLQSASIDDLELDLIRLSELVLIPGIRKVERKAVHSEINTKKKEINSVLKFELDVMVQFFRESDPKFVHEYDNARDIVDVQGKRRSKTDDESPERDDGESMAS